MGSGTVTDRKQEESPNRTRKGKERNKVGERVY
jgi:hypothetical protein